MAVTQYFTVDLPEGVDVNLPVLQDDTLTVTLSREDAESLCADLTVALHPEGVPSPEEGIQEVLAGFLAQLNTGGYEQMLEDHPVGPPMSPDEALARVQATAASQSVPPGPVRNPGTGIGNG